jgi:hypothetical protein
MMLKQFLAKLRGHRCSMRIAMAILAIALPEIPTEAQAGQIYGQITAGGTSVKEGVQVVITCGDARATSTQTDRFGAYQVYVAVNGRCHIAVHFGGAPIESDVVSYPNPVRYNFDIVGRGAETRLMRK